MARTSDPAPLDREALRDPVRAVLGTNTAAILDWQRETLYGSGDPKTGGVYRVAGSAAVQGETRPWSLVLKVLHAAGGETEPTRPNYWKREVLAYQSGLLAALPDGVAAPRCFGVTAFADESAWLWLEEVTGMNAFPWRLSSYGTAAYLLGRFNGASCGEPALLDAPWLSRGWLAGSWLAQFPEDLAAALARVMEHPLVRQICPGPTGARLLHLMTHRTPFLAALDRLPQTFCHHDAWCRNLLLRRDHAGRDHALLIDWADAGSGALGQELASFVWAPVAYMDLDSTALHDLEDLAWSRYLDGLRAVGWRGDPAAVRLGYTADVALRCASTAWLCTFLPDERAHRRLEDTLGHLLEEIVTTQARLLPFLLDRADEARGLLGMVL